MAIEIKDTFETIIMKMRRAEERAARTKCPRTALQMCFLASWHRWRLARLALSEVNGTGFQPFAMGHLNQVAREMRRAWEALQNTTC